MSSSDRVQPESATESAPLIPAGDEPPVLDRRPKWHETLRFVLSYNWAPSSSPSYKLSVVATFAVVLLTRIVGLAPPIILKFIVDKISACSNVQRPLNAQDVPVVLIGYYFGADVLSLGLQNVEDVLVSLVYLEAQKKSAVDIFAHLMKLDLDYHLMKQSGEVGYVHPNVLFDPIV